MNIYGDEYPNYIYTDLIITDYIDMWNYHVTWKYTSILYQLKKFT